MTKLLVKNKKIAKTNKINDVTIFNFGISAHRSVNGELICRQALNCINPCYANQKTFTWPVVVAAYDYRYQQSKRNDFVEQIVTSIRKKKKISHVRIHDSGDFYSEKYLVKWLTIARDNPSVTFYCYTKEIEMFKRLRKFFPNNFKAVFSYGGKQDHLIDPKIDRHARVFNTLDAVPSHYVNASSDDLLAIGDNKNIALVYHGANNRKNNKFVEAV